MTHPINRSRIFNVYFDAELDSWMIREGSASGDFVMGVGHNASSILIEFAVREQFQIDPDDKLRILKPEVQ